jgi:ribosome recycling factor
VTKAILDDAESRMTKALESLRVDLTTVRTGRATPALLDRVTVECWGQQTPINQTANISCPEPRLILVQPWDKSLLPQIDKAIRKSDLGFNPNSDGSVLRIAVPPLTEERRKELIKLCKQKGEDSKVAVRNIRRDAIDRLKTAEKAKEFSEDESRKAQDSAQKLTDKYIAKVDEILVQKEKDILEI